MERADVLHDISTLSQAYLAAQLTLTEHRLFAAIPLNEFFFGSWKRPNKDTLCPHIVTLIAWFNRVTDWIITEIVMALTVKQRVKVLKKFIYIADVRRHFHFCSCFPFRMC